jgi:hypothetical protein
VQRNGQGEQEQQQGNKLEDTRDESGYILKVEPIGFKTD